MADIAPLPVQNWPQMQADADLTANQSGLVGQQAQQAGIQTQIAKAQLPIVLDALASAYGPVSGQSGVTPGGMPDSGSPQSPQVGAGTPDQTSQTNSSGDPSSDPNSAYAMLRRNFFINPAGTPAEQKAIYVAALSGNPALLNAAKYRRDLGVQQRTAESQYNASNLYDQMASVVNAKRRDALYTLQGIEPGVVKAIERKYTDPEEQDAMARYFASHVGAQVHMYTGRKVEVNKAGEYRDSATGLPIPGVSMMGLSDQQATALAEAGLKPTTVPLGNGASALEPLWKAAKYPSLAAWMMATARKGGVPGAQPTISGAPVMHVQSAITRAIPAAQAKVAAQNNGVTPQITATDPQLVAALKDRNYRLPQLPATPGVSATPGQIEQQKQTVDARTKLLQDSQMTTQAAAQAMTYLKAAQEILQSKGKYKPTVGFWGPMAAQASRMVNGVDASNWQAVVKNLSNAALQNARQLYGSRFTQAEVMLQLHEMNPSATMTPQAMAALINENMQLAQYAVASARRVRPYLSVGNDPMNFQVWNQRYFPMQKAVNSPAVTSSGAAPNAPTATGPNGQKLVLQNGRWVPLNARAQ